MFDTDHIVVYRELLNRGGWAEVRHPYYVIDEHALLRTFLSDPSLIASHKIVESRFPIVLIVSSIDKSPKNTGILILA